MAASGWFACRAHGETHFADHCAFLLPRRVEQRLNLFALAHVFGVSDDANDFDFAFVVDKGDMLAHHVFVGKELARKGLTRHGDLGSTLVILRSEAASAQERDFHRAK